MDGLPKKGDRVRWADPWFYDGEGTVLAVQKVPHHAVQVMILEVDEEKYARHWLGRTTWLLPGHLTVIAPGAPPPGPGN